MSEFDPEVYGYDPSPPSLSWSADAAKTPAQIETGAVARVRRFLSMFVGPNDIIAETSLHFDGEPIPLRAADLRRALAAPRISEAVLALAAAAYRLGAELDDPIPDTAVRKQYLGEIVRAERVLSTDDRLLLSRIAPPPLTPKPDLVELVERVRKAENTLLREMEQSVEKERKAHLRSKAEGVRLVLSYIVEMTRG